MPEGTHAYPRWNGSRTDASPVGLVFSITIRRALRSTWALLVLLAGLGWGLSSTIEVLQFRQDGVSTHEVEWFAAMIGQLHWLALGVAAIVGGSAILDDQRQGAIELYLSRHVTPGQYTLGKATAVWALTFSIYAISALLYVLATLAFFDEAPPDWTSSVVLGLVTALMWSFMVSGLALGMASVARSARGVAVMLFGAFAGLQLVVSRLLASLTEDDRLEILSPFSAMQRQDTWVYGITTDLAFPAWWGLLVIAALTIAGWSLLYWRRPGRMEDSA